MIRNNAIILLFTLLFLSCFSFSVYCQTAVAAKRKLIVAYLQADRYYLKALHNTNNNERAEEKWNRSALKSFSLLVKDLKGQNHLEDSLYLLTALKLGELYHYFDSLPDALFYYRKAIELRKFLPELPDTILFKPWLYSGMILYHQNKLDTALYYFKQAEILLNSSGGKLQESERLFNSLGALYFESGNYRQSRNYFSKALSVLPRYHPYYKNLLVNYTINYATSGFKLEEYEEAEGKLERLLSYKEHLNEIYHNLGLIKLYEGMPLKALSYFKKVHYNNSSIIGLYNDMAHSWMKLNYLDSAKNYITLANKVFLQYYSGSTSIDHGLTLKLSGDIEKDNGQYQEALISYQKALHQFYPAFTGTSVSLEPLRFSGLFSYLHLFETIIAKAEVFHLLYLDTKDITYETKEMEAFQSAYVLIDYVERHFESDESRLFLGKTRYLLHDPSVLAAYDLYRKTNDPHYLEEAFRMDQMNKASVLVLNELQNKMIDPSSPLMKTEKYLKTRITELQISLNNEKDSYVKSAINLDISNKEIELGKLQEKIAASYPVLYKEVPSVSYLQSNFLDNKTQIISYHLTEDVMTVFSIKGKNPDVIQKPVYGQYHNDLKELLQIVHDPAATGDYKKTESVKRISSFLIDGIVSKDYSRIIIIPENELNMVPFEALLLLGNYLMESHSVQYQYSAMLLKKEDNQDLNGSALSFAPFALKGFTDSETSYNRLPYSIDELNNVKGERIIGEKATKAYFIQNAPHYKLIHLATHAVGNDSSGRSYIVFAPWNSNSREGYLLYSSEIYNLSFPSSELIILSACETGSGALLKGEGIMSISRAFAYAGCPNIITSLWKADDLATRFIINRFYHYIRNGLKTDEALHQAKKDYLDSKEINPHMKAPAFWAHLVFVGNYVPDTTSYKWVISLIIIFSGIIALFLIRRNNNIRSLRIKSWK